MVPPIALIANRIKPDQSMPHALLLTLLFATSVAAASTPETRPKAATCSSPRARTRADAFEETNARRPSGASATIWRRRPPSDINAVIRSGINTAIVTPSASPNATHWQPQARMGAPRTGHRSTMPSPQRRRGENLAECWQGGAWASGPIGDSGPRLLRDALDRPRPHAARFYNNFRPSTGSTSARPGQQLGRMSEAARRRGARRSAPARISPPPPPPRRALGDRSRRRRTRPRSKVPKAATVSRALRRRPDPSGTSTATGNSRPPQVSSTGGLRAYVDRLVSPVIVLRNATVPVPLYAVASCGVLRPTRRPSCRPSCRRRRRASGAAPSPSRRGGGCRRSRGSAGRTEIGVPSIAFIRGVAARRVELGVLQHRPLAASDVPNIAPAPRGRG